MHFKKYSGIKFCTSDAIKKSQTSACVIDSHCTQYVINKLKRII